VLFGNLYLSAIRIGFERMVTERFLENYVRGIRDCTFVPRNIDSNPEKSVFVIKGPTNGSKHTVINWICSCK
jgi:hypothetical protein